MEREENTLSGSGANARVAGDDEEMQRFVPIEDLVKGRHFDRQIIVLCVSWYTSFKLSLRDLVIMMAERGISVTHTTIQAPPSTTGGLMVCWAARLGTVQPVPGPAPDYHVSMITSC